MKRSIHSKIINKRGINLLKKYFCDVVGYEVDVEIENIFSGSLEDINSPCIKGRTTCLENKNGFCFEQNCPLLNN